MLSDLVQYFTIGNVELKDFENIDLVDYIAYVHDHTRDDYIRSRIEDAVIYYGDGFYDINEYGFNEETYINDMHLSDALGLSYENTLLTTLLSTVISTTTFSVTFQDVGLNLLCDDEDDILHPNIKHYCPFLFERKIDRFVNGFFVDIIRKDYCSEDGNIDSYSAEVDRCIASYIKFDKSVGRRIRKAYSLDGRVREMFHALGYFMMNGEFIFLAFYNVEASYYDGGIDMDTVYLGLDALRNSWFDYPLSQNRSIAFDKALRMLNYKLQDSDLDYGFHSVFFNSIMSVHKCSGKDVIL